MKNFYRMAQGVDLGLLALEIARQPELWNQNPERLWKGSPHDQTDDIWVRFKAKDEIEKSGFKDEHESVWYPSYYALPSVRGLVFDLMARVQGERLGGVLIYRVPPGKQITPHVDKGWHPEAFEKFNFAIQSQPGCAFYYPEHGEAMEAVTGDVHWFKNTVPHGVRNDSHADHIIMCVNIQTHAFRTGG